MDVTLATASAITSIDEGVRYRGGRWLTRDEFLPQLASLIRLEHVVLLLGSGASVPVGGKTMAGLWADFALKHPKSLEWLRDERFVVGEDPPNIEALADTLEIARLEWNRVENPKLNQLRTVIGDIKRAVIRAATLKAEYWDATDISAINMVGLDAHRTILQRLCAARQPGQTAPWVFTTNYDLAVEWACESLGLKVVNGFSGLHFREFAPHNFDLGYRNTLARGEARFGTYNIYLAKLHGSLTWRANNTTLSEW